MKTTFKAFLESKVEYPGDVEVFVLRCDAESLRDDPFISECGVLVAKNNDEIVGFEADLKKVAEKHNLTGDIEPTEEYKATRMVSKLQPKEDLTQLIATMNEKNMHYMVKIIGTNESGSHDVYVIHDDMEDPRDLHRAGGHEEVPVDVEDIEDEKDLFYLHWPEKK